MADLMTGAAFKRLRQQLGESQAGLAELFQVSPLTIHKTEHKTVVPEKYARAITALSRREPFLEDLRAAGTGRGRPSNVSRGILSGVDLSEDADALEEYNKIVTAAAALYRIKSGKVAARQARTPEEAARWSFERAEAARRLREDAANVERAKHLTPPAQSPDPPVRALTPEEKAARRKAYDEYYDENPDSVRIYPED